MKTLRGRRWLVAVLAVGYALIAIGMPLPLGTLPGVPTTDAARRLLDAKDRSQPFPCRDKPCGCTSAAQCFTSCCCNTPAETLAWARAHGLDAGVITALQRRVADEPPAAAAKASCCAADTPAPPTSCCSADAGGSADALDRCPEGEGTCPDAPSDEPVSCHTVVLQAMLACGGMLGEWLSTAEATLPLPPVAVVCMDPLDEPLLLSDEHAPRRGVAPDLPPPRVA